MRYRMLFLGLIVCALAYADIPKTINFQGRLTDASGKFVADGNYSLTFKIYTDSTGGTAKWTETRSVAVNQGLFNVVLGTTTAIPDSIFSYVNSFLGIQVGADPEMSPRQRLSSLGYAYRGAKADSSSYSMNSDKLDGLHSSDFSSIATDYGRSGVATNLYEGDSTLTSKYVNEAQANSITSGMITNGEIVDADISASANITPSKISGTAWTSTNDGTGSGLDADLLDGQQASAFVTTAFDYGRSGVTPQLYEGTTALANKYVAQGQNNSITSVMITDDQIVNADISTTAAISPSKISGTAWTSSNDGTGSGLDADVLDGQQASAFATSSHNHDATYVNVTGPDSVVAASGTAFKGRVSASSAVSVNGIQGYADNSSTGGAVGGYFSTSSSGSGSHYGVQGSSYASSVSPTFGSYGYADNSSSGVVYGGHFGTSSSGTGTHYGIRAVGEGATSATTYGAYGTADNNSSGSVYGGYFTTTDRGTGNHYGVLAEGYGSSSSPVYGSSGYANNSSSGVAYGGFFSTSSSGTGEHYGLRAEGYGSTSNNTFGLSSNADNTSSGWAYGGSFSTSFNGTGAHFGITATGNGQSSSPVYGVLGKAEHYSTGNAYGGLFDAQTSGAGAHYGIKALAQGSSDSSTYGVYGYARNNSAGVAYGGYFLTYSSGSGSHFGVVGIGDGPGEATGGYFYTQAGGTGIHYGVKGDAWASSGATTYGSYGYASNGSTGEAFGGKFKTSAGGTGTHYGVNGEAYGNSSASVYGAYGYASNTSTGQAVGGYFTAATSGTGHHVGVETDAISSSSASWALGVDAFARNTAQDGYTFGGFFEARQAYLEYKAYAVYGSTPRYEGFAGWFVGDVFVYNDLQVNGTKFAAVKVDNGEYRLLACQESPEVWFEDFGEGQLTNGRAHIELDPLFLQTVTINSQHPMKVFIQLNDENCKGTAVKRGTTGFDVIELLDGTSNASFSYRIVAKRKGHENQRLVKREGPPPEEVNAMAAKHQAEREQMRTEMEKKQEESRQE